MEKTQKKFLMLLLAVLALSAIVSIDASIQKYARGITQFILSGYSNGKLVLALAWFTLLPILCAVSLKLKIYARLEKNSQKFFKIFVIATIVLFITGLIQFGYFSVQFGSKTNFATLLSKSGYTNWESSQILHNHFPKITLYFLEKTFGINPGNHYDDGQPFFQIFPNAELWSLLYIAILLVILASGLLHLFSVGRKIKIFDFIVFALMFLGAIIHGLDGGIGEGTSAITIFLIILYWTRNYSKMQGSWKNLMPLLLFGFIALVAWMAADLSAGVAVSTAPILVIGILYYFIKEASEKRISANFWPNAFLAIVLLVSINNAYITLSVITNGSWVYDFSEQAGSGLKIKKGADLFIYGIPKNQGSEEVKEEIEKFGKILDFDRRGWVVFARILPNEPFQAGSLEDRLIEKLKPKNYLYVEGSIPAQAINEFKLYFLENKPIELDNNFLGIEILSQKYEKKTNSLTLLVKGEYQIHWQMLAILTEAEAQGLEKQALLVK
ncbi:MAG: hypothetical protein QT12_C0002G0004 [archaeon GW2011_AR21]|uniref:Uncharacterized protein n=1 Tax=Candidatus Iainarchaeum sp. TaxID=3101447 RepID=A0A7J4JUP7_9ARCH|nr:MAG: hypothetical protein QT12_C0002G0004 [archaeon GW2011_AR21]HIH21184.1 hypothetical protein [Candidatus Diapherotrites archaeon]